MFCRPERPHTPQQRRTTTWKSWHCLSPTRETLWTNARTTRLYGTNPTARSLNTTLHDVSVGGDWVHAGRVWTAQRTRDLILNNNVLYSRIRNIVDIHFGKYFRKIFYTSKCLLMSKPIKSKSREGSSDFERGKNRMLLKSDGLVLSIAWLQEVRRKSLLHQCNKLRVYSQVVNTAIIKEVRNRLFYQLAMRKFAKKISVYHQFVEKQGKVEYYLDNYELQLSIS